MKTLYKTLAMDALLQAVNTVSLTRKSILVSPNWQWQKFRSFVPITAKVHQYPAPVSRHTSAYRQVVTRIR